MKQFHLIRSSSDKSGNRLYLFHTGNYQYEISILARDVWVTAMKIDGDVEEAIALLEKMAG